MKSGKVRKKRPPRFRSVRIFCQSLDFSALFDFKRCEYTCTRWALGTCADTPHAVSRRRRNLPLDAQTSTSK